MADLLSRLSALSCLALIVACDQPEATPGRSQPGKGAGASAAAGGAENGVRLALLPPSGEMLMASLEGVLHAEGRCLYIVGTDSSKNPILPVFHIAGIRWDPATRTLHARNAAMTHGQRVVLGGGNVMNPAALDWLQPPDPSCDTSRLFMAGTIEPVEE